MTTKTRTAQPTKDTKAEAMAYAEQQLEQDRAIALNLLGQMADAIMARSKSGVARTIVEINWLEHRITQTETMASPLWCLECAGAGSLPAEYPGNPWMVFECLEHAAEPLARSVKSWERSLFGGMQ